MKSASRSIQRWSQVTRRPESGVASVMDGNLGRCASSTQISGPAAPSPQPRQKPAGAGRVGLIVIAETGAHQRLFIADADCGVDPDGEDPQEANQTIRRNQEIG